MMENPCHGSERRRWDCHGDCKAYHGWKAANAESERDVRERVKMGDTLALLKQQGVNSIRKKKHNRR